jgi:hypothetical protein
MDGGLNFAGMALCRLILLSPFFCQFSSDFEGQKNGDRRINSQRYELPAV